MEEQLEQLVRQVKQAPLDSMDRQQTITHLAQQILKARQVVRPFRGRLTGIYQEIAEQAQRYLQQLLEQRIDSYYDHRMSLGQWTRDLRSETFQAVLSRSSLQQLALAAKQHKPRTPGHQYAISQLIQAIQFSGKLARLQFTPDIYQDAVNQTLLWVCQNIHSYDADRGDFMSWVNYRLDKIGQLTQQAQQDPYTQAIQGKIIRTKHQLSALLRQLKATDLLDWLMLYARRLILDLNLSVIAAFVTLLNLSIAVQQSPDSKSGLLFRVAQELVDLPPPLVYSEDLSLTEISQEEPLSLADMLRQYVEEDQDHLLKKQIQGHPEPTLQTLILARLEGKSWHTLSQQYGIKVPTLSNFFQRSLTALAPKIREAIQSQFSISYDFPF
ncbi:hypothetical protein H6F87_03780 [Cyanobacteria bacterium FACHB-502]|nr:hypothetical protein [Cyanobacteria bacterium FACHB-502]